MGKKRAAAVSAVAAAPIFPFPATDATQPDHFSDYGFDPQLVHSFSQQPEAKRPWSRRHHHHQPSHSSKPLESTRFKLQKPISKKHHHEQHLHKQQHQRRRWWSSAALLLLKFKRRSSSSSSPAAAASPTYWSAASVPAVPLYLADDDGPSACTCWAPNGPVRRPGRMAAAELGDAAVSVPYVSIRSTGLGGAGRAGGDTPAMPIYLVT